MASADRSCWIAQRESLASHPIWGTEPAVRLLEHRLNLDAARVTQQVERDLLEDLPGPPSGAHTQSKPSSRVKDPQTVNAREPEAQGLGTRRFGRAR